MDQTNFVAQLANLRTSSTFLTLHGYHDEHGGISDFSIVFHMSYENALKSSLDVMNAYIPENDLEAQAKLELIDSFTTSLTKSETTKVEDIDDAYSRFFNDDGSPVKGIKLHRDTDTLHIYGLIVHKNVITPAVYPKRNRKPLTIAKDKLHAICKVNAFRQFKITPDKVDCITVEHISLLPPA